MKFNKLFILFFLALGLSLNNANIFAQDDDDDDDDDDQQMEEMDEEEWQRQMDELNAEKSNLTTKLAQLNGEIDNLKGTSANKDKELEKCENDLYALVGTTKSGVADFRKKFEETEKKINGKVGTPADARKMYFDDITKDKARCLPEFQDRYASMKKKLADWEGTPVNEACYTVVKGDCLWKISSSNYRTPYLWPAIWEANRSEIDDPNFLYPGQVLKIPSINDEDRKNALERSKHYRKSRKTQNNLQN